MRAQVLSLLEKYEERILGQSTTLRLLLSAILSGGHVLLEGVPGTGKTQMVRTLANLLGGDFDGFSLRQTYFQVILLEV